MENFSLIWRTQPSFSLWREEPENLKWSVSTQDGNLAFPVFFFFWKSYFFKYIAEVVMQEWFGVSSVAGLWFWAPGFGYKHGNTPTLPKKIPNQPLPLHEHKCSLPQCGTGPGSSSDQTLSERAAAPVIKGSCRIRRLQWETQSISMDFKRRPGPSPSTIHYQEPSNHCRDRNCTAQGQAQSAA